MAEVRRPEPAPLAPSQPPPVPRPAAQAPKQRQGVQRSAVFAIRPRTPNARGSLRSVAPPATGVADGAAGGVMAESLPRRRRRLCPSQRARMSSHRRQRRRIDRQAIRALSVFRIAIAARPRLQAAAGRCRRRASLGLRYSVLRKEGADFVADGPRRTEARRRVALRFTANTNGSFRWTARPRRADGDAAVYHAPLQSIGTK